MDEQRHAGDADPANERETRRETVEAQVRKHLGEKRQAVVVIHGMGSQRPMDTLRPFVEAVLGVRDPADAVKKYYSKPDLVSDSYELRRLRTRWHEDNSALPRTDFFEFYWQHLMPRGQWRSGLEWLKLLLSRRAKDVPPALRRCWRCVWLITAAIFSTLAYGAYSFLLALVQTSSASLPNFGLPLAVSFVLGAVGYLALSYIGDAAVYLSPDPRNVGARRDIRVSGISLLKRLHALEDDNGDPKYERIVLVGHSLGSVIGYDILTHMWPRFNVAYQQPEQTVDCARSRLEAAAKDLWDLRRSPERHKERVEAEVAWLRETRCTWLEQRANSFPWRITDFVTLGSPLAHGLLLLAKSADDFERKQSQRELPTSPPRLDDEDRLQYSHDYTGGSVWALHHAAVFSVTRWTNLFFPDRYFFKGDFIGGPVGDFFGPGVADWAVGTTAHRGWFAHTKYWQGHKSTAPAVRALIDALDLERRTFDPSWLVPDEREILVSDIRAIRGAGTHTRGLAPKDLLGATARR